MERENFARAIVHVVVVAKTGKDVSRLVGKANVNFCGGIFEFALSVTSCLLGYGRELLSLVMFFGFNQPARGAIDKDKVIAWASGRLPFTDNDAACRRGIELFDILDNISGSF